MSTAPQTKPAKVRVALVLAVVALVLVAVAAVVFVYLYPGSGPATPEWEANANNLKPVIGAFGWKLGERLPESLTNQVSNGRYNFHPATNLPPFSQFELDLTEDAHIYEVRATGYAPGSGADSSACLKNLVFDLARQYGLLHHKPNSAYPELDTYVFGTATKNAHLDIFQDDLFTLELVDQHLFALHAGEPRAKPR